MNRPLKKTLYIAILMAITIVMGRFFLIPIPFTHGNVNLCDAGIMICALLLGSKAGLIVGGFSGMILDLISGYSQYMMFSLLIHGLEGFICGWIFSRSHSKLLATTCAAIIMVVGYFIADSLLYSFTVGALGIIGNIFQGLIGMIISLSILPKLNKIGMYK